MKRGPPERRAEIRQVRINAMRARANSIAGLFLVSKIASSKRLISLRMSSSDQLRKAFSKMGLRLK